jgi:hypothetical protein
MRTTLIEKLDVHEEDIESRPMGSSGEDLIMARAAREKFPFSIECKNAETGNVWKHMEQAKANAKLYTPIVVMKKNNEKPLVVIDAEVFVDMVSEINEGNKTYTEKARDYAKVRR